jgi:hypothetical protein
MIFLNRFVQKCLGDTTLYHQKMSFVNFLIFLDFLQRGFHIPNDEINLYRHAANSHFWLK